MQEKFGEFGGYSWAEFRDVSRTSTVESDSSLLKRRIMRSWRKGVRSILRPTWTKCASDSIIGIILNLFRDTILKLIATPNLKYKQLTAKVQHAA